MAVAYLSRVVRFTAWHRYFRPAWDTARNHEAFGAAGREPAHGHDYSCTVTIRGTPDPETGMIADLGVLDRLLREEVTDRFDGHHLNEDVAEFAFGREVPTGEALCVHLWQRLNARLPAGVSLAAVRVAEDATLYAEYRGE